MLARGKCARICNAMIYPKIIFNDSLNHSWNTICVSKKDLVDWVMLSFSFSVRAWLVWEGSFALIEKLSGIAEILSLVGRIQKLFFEKLIKRTSYVSTDMNSGKSN